MRTLVCVMTIMLVAATVLGQDYRSLEGTTVTAKIDMPASREGMDIHPGMESALDLHKAAERIKQYGVAVHAGQSALITSVVVKPHDVEVLLGGGGYGTFTDSMMLADETPPIPYRAETRREKDLMEQLKYTNDYWERERIRRELDEMERQHHRTDQKVQTSEQQVEQQKRSAAGSRFNIRYDGAMPEDAATRSRIVAALSNYVEFERTPGEQQGGLGRWSLTDMARRGRPEDSPMPALRKGLTVQQVAQILGPASRVEDRSDGALEIDFREYNRDGQRVTAEFVGGVVVNYTVTPQ